MERRLSRPDPRAVYAAATPELSMAELDRRLGYQLAPLESEAPDALRWYARVQDSRLLDLSDEDVTVALVNDLHLPMLIPVGVERLRANPTAGMLYEGQLMHALAHAAAVMKNAFPQLGDQVREALGVLRPALPLTLHPLLDEALLDLA